MTFNILLGLHILAVIAWMAGMLYLPRLFVYHVDARDPGAHERFCVMERRLYVMTTLGMIGTWLLGIGLLLNADVNKDVKLNTARGLK